jgi:hypothetical protein
MCTKSAPYNKCFDNVNQGKVAVINQAPHHKAVSGAERTAPRTVNLDTRRPLGKQSPVPIE